METVKQKTSAPTNKLTTAVVVSAVWGWVGLTVANLAPDWHNPEVWQSSETMLIALIGYYLAKDAPNA